MKKFKILFLAAASFLISNISFAQTPTANGNVMIFNGVVAYESFTENENTWLSLRNVAVQSSTLTTMAEQESLTPLNADTLYPDFLKEVLNIDQIFQIGTYLIKIDEINNRGLMINAGNANAYSDLVNNNLSASGMMVLDGDEDFGLELLEALENNTITPVDYQNSLTAERRCSGARRQTQKDIPTWITTNEECPGNVTLGRTYGMDDKLVYQKFIFYFSLQSKIRSVWRCTYGGSWTLAEIYNLVDLKLIGTVKYRRRCAAEVNKAETLEEGYFSGGNGILNWRPYSGGRSLSHYDFNVDFGIRVATDRNPNPPPYFFPHPYRIVSGY
ncbi:hypothetical protein [Ferruginibacter sp.]